MRFVRLVATFVALAALALTPSASAAPARRTPTAIPCATPTPLLTVWTVKGLAYSGWFTLPCLSPGETLTSVVIHWGDRTTSVGTVGYEQPDAAGYVEALVVGSHVYRRQTSITFRSHCSPGFRPYVSAIDAQTGQPIAPWHGTQICVAGQVGKSAR